MTVIFGGKMAFPIHNTGHGAPFDEGMSLRDYIAIQAMQSFILSGIHPKIFELCQDSYTVADTMLEYRTTGEHE